MPLDQFKDFLSHEQLQMIHKINVKTTIGLYVVEPWARLSGMKEERIIAYSMVESDAIGAGWLGTLNSMRAVIAPNEFISHTFESCGVKVPIHVIPPSVNTDAFKYMNRGGRSVFTFGMAGYMDDRKSALEVIQAFVSEFKGEKGVRLMIHSTNTDFGYWKGLKDPRITISTKPMKSDEVVDFYHSVDCYLAPSKGEGIGMTVLEAMATGLPVIGTKWGGMTDIMSGFISYPLTEFELKPRPLMLEQPGNWAYPDVQELMYWMRYTFEHQHEARMVGEWASDHIQKFHNEKRIGKQLADVLKLYEPI